jgi:cytoskeletal protein RodZ
MDESIGARLKQARELRRLTLQQVSETTKVRPHYLQALENDDLSAISSAAQARGFLRIYADFLGLNLTDLIQVRSPSKQESITQSSSPSSDQSLSSVEETSQKIKSERPGLITGLLNRLTRRSVKETTPSKVTETAPPVEIPVTPEPKPFVPARVTEELPVAPDKKVEEPVSTLKAMESEPHPATESVPTVKISKKAVSKPRKTSPRSDKQNEVKKKVNE